MPGFEYQWEECEKRFLGICSKWVTKVDYYDLTNQATRDELLAAGFVGKVREIILP